MSVILRVQVWGYMCHGHMWVTVFEWLYVSDCMWVMMHEKVFVSKYVRVIMYEQIFTSNHMRGLSRSWPRHMCVHTSVYNNVLLFVFFNRQYLYSSTTCITTTFCYSCCPTDNICKYHWCTTTTVLWFVFFNRQYLFSSTNIENSTKMCVLSHSTYLQGRRPCWGNQHDRMLSQSLRR